MRRFQLKRSCGACPEVWDYYYENEYIGYLRLRHGYLRVCFEPSGETVYQADSVGDGIFDSDEERTLHLNQGCIALNAAMDRKEESDCAAPLYDVIYEESNEDDY